MKDDSKSKVEIMMQELLAIRSEKNKLQQDQTTYASICLAAIATVFALSLTIIYSNDLNENTDILVIVSIIYFLIIPVIFYYYSIYWCMNLSQIRTALTYLCKIEQKINCLCNSKHTLESSTVYYESYSLGYLVKNDVKKSIGFEQLRFFLILAPLISWLFFYYILYTKNIEIKDLECLIQSIFLFSGLVYIAYIFILIKIFKNLDMLLENLIDVMNQK